MKKRAISLLLIFAMVLCLLMTSVSAAGTTSSGFSDYSAIKHKEAVSYMVKLGLITGIEREDGTYAYQPSGVLDRAGLAKLVVEAVTLVSGDVATAKETPSFTDIDGHWAEAYIEYAADNGIIDGNGDDTFAPDGPVIGWHAAKVFLAAMGVEGLTGADWQSKTKAAAEEAGLLEGITADMSESITRDDAAQLVWNALENEFIADPKGAQLLPSATIPALPKVYVIEENTSATFLRIEENSLFIAPEGKSVTMTVGGVERGLNEPGAHMGDIRLVVTDDNPIYHKNSKQTHYFRQGIFVDDSGYVSGKSVDTAVKGGTVTDARASGFSITSYGEDFNGVYVGGGADYTIKDAGMTLIGNGHNDFVGYGAAVTVDTGARTVLDNVDIFTHGVTRSAIVVNNGGNAVVKNSVITTEEGVWDSGYIMNSTLGYMFNVPWTLGLIGNNRATNVLGGSLEEPSLHSIINSKYYCEAWGVLSVDDINYGRVTGINSLFEITGSSGYGSYQIGMADNSFYGCTFNVPDYAAILTRGHVTYGSSTAEKVKELNKLNNMGLTETEMAAIEEKPTVLNTGRAALMFHDATYNSATFEGKVDVNAGREIFLFRGANGVVNVDGSDGVTMDSDIGVITQMLDYDKVSRVYGYYADGTKLARLDHNEWVDPYADVSEVPRNEEWDVTTVTTGGITKGKALQEKFAWANADGVVQNFKDMTLVGDFYNGTNGGGKLPCRNLAVNFVNTSITGVITASFSYHERSFSAYADVDMIGKVENIPHNVINNGVIVDLDATSVWTVTGTSYLSKLTVASDANIRAEAGKNVTMTVDGVATPITAGTYVGDIVITVA